MTSLAVIPVLVGPLQVLLAVLPAILIAAGTTLVALLKPSSFKKLLKLLWRLKLQVAGLVACVAGLWWGGSWAMARLSPKSGGIEQGAADWPMIRGSLARTGAVPGTASPRSGGIRWQHKKGNEAVFSSPAAVGNRVFVSIADMAAFGQSGRIHAFDADTGRIAWTGAPPNYEPTFSSPVVAGNYVVCGEGLHWAKKARVVCLALDSGKVVWTAGTNSHVECSPVIADGRVYVGAGDDGYYCFDLETGKQLWHTGGEKYPDAETALAVHDGKVYAGLGMGGHALCVLDAVTGRELHRIELPYPVFSPPTIVGNKLYLGMGNGDYVNPGKGGAVVCLDLATLRTDWTFPLEMTVLGSVAATADRLFFTSRDGNVYALTREGKQVAKFEAHVPISASPAATDDMVYAVTEAGMLYGLDRENLRPVWEYRLGSKPLFISAPTVARGHVYVGTQNDGLLCVGDPGAPAPPQATVNDLSPIPDAGALEWNYPPEQQGANADCLTTGPVVVLGDTLHAGPLAIRLRDEPAAAPATPVPELPEPSLAIAGEEGFLVARDQPTGRELWRLPANATSAATVVGDRFYVGTATAIECRSVLDGRLLWSADAASPVGPPLVSRGRLLYATAESLMLMDLETRETRPWMDISWLGKPCGPMTLKDSRVYLPVAGWGIVCLGGAK
jgi:outer membrane protein assembly factor BamB